MTWEQGAASDVVVQLRVKDSRRPTGATGPTSGPTTLSRPTSGDVAGAATRGGTAPYWTGPWSGIEVIVQGAGGVVPQDVRVALIDPGKSQADRDPASRERQEPGACRRHHAPRLQPGPVGRRRVAADLGPGVRVDDQGRDDPPHRRPQRLQRRPCLRDDAGHLRVPRGQTRGWGDIGYNVVVDRFGRLFEGRFGGLASHRHRRARRRVQHLHVRRLHAGQLRHRPRAAGDGQRGRRRSSPGSSTCSTSTRAERRRSSRAGEAPPSTPPEFVSPFPRSSVTVTSGTPSARGSTATPGSVRSVTGSPSSPPRTRPGSPPR